MTRSHTIRVDYEFLARRGPSAATVIKLMMACNDMSLADQSLASWMNAQPPSRRGRQIWAQMYFVRLMLAHLNEAISIVDAIRKDSQLMALVEQCDSQTQASFEALEEFLRGGVRFKEFESLVGRLRNNVTFHYDESGKLVNKALAELAARTVDRSSTLTRGSRAHVWHFKVADSVVNNVVCHQIWQIPLTADVQTEADQKVSQCHAIFLRFVDFAGEFIWKYCKS